MKPGLISRQFSSIDGSNMLTHIAFWYLRHGETAWNAKNLSQGNVEVPLNATGIAQAHKAGEGLAGQGIGSIVASTLGRARETAQIVADRLALTFTTDPDLREAAFGIHEGTDMGGWFDEWVAGQYTPPGGESFADLRVRAMRAVNRALDLPGPVLIVAHGALFRAVRAEMGLSPGVRTANGVAMLCRPGVPQWHLEAGKEDVLS